MSKLSSKQRKELPQEDFGLPQQKKFPIHDEAHIRSAIAYFHTCPDKDKKELANNINRKAKELNMKIKLKKYSAFKPYADKEIISESASLILPNLISLSERQSVLSGSLKEFFHNDNPCINSAIKKFSDSYLTTNYLHNGRIDTYIMDDIFYDNDMKLSEKIIDDFIKSKNFNKSDIKSLYNKDILSDLFKKFNDEINCKFTEDLYNEINSIIDSIENDLVSCIDNIIQDNNWNDYTLKNISRGDFIMANESKFHNFTEEEINFFINYHPLIEKLCNLTKYFLITKYNFPPMNVERLDNDIYYLDHLNLISGYYISGDNDNINKESLFNSVIKIDQDIYAMCYIYRDKISSTVVSIKVRDHNSDEYFNHISDIFISNKYKQLPEMDINKITYSHSKCNFDSCVKI